MNTIHILSINHIYGQCIGINDIYLVFTIGKQNNIDLQLFLSVVIHKSLSTNVNMQCLLTYVIRYSTILLSFNYQAVVSLPDCQIHQIQQVKPIAVVHEVHRLFPFLPIVHVDHLDNVK